MGGDANSTDHATLDRFLNTVLDHYRDGVISWTDAHSALSSVIKLAGSRDGNMTRHMQAYLDHNPRDDL